MAAPVAGVGIDREAAGVGTGLDAAGAGAGAGRDAAGAAAGAGLGAGFGREVIFDGCPPGPPFRSSLPVVIGLAIALPLGVGLETELGDSPGPTWTVPDLY